MLSELVKSNRAAEYTRDFVFNGVLFLTLFFLAKFSFLYFSPTIWYFEYTAVEPFTVPAFISDEYIEMQSTLRVDREGELAWNDVLRCVNDNNGRFDYVGEYNTKSATVIETNGLEVSRWRYRGEMPDQPTFCRMDSTITRQLQFGIVKKQFIQSSVFPVEL